MAAYERLKNEFTEDEKYHNLMRWLINNFPEIAVWGGGAGRRRAGNQGVILVRMCGPTFQNSPHSYTLALKIGIH